MKTLYVLSIIITATLINFSTPPKPITVKFTEPASLNAFTKIKPIWHKVTPDESFIVNDTIMDVKSKLKMVLLPFHKRKSDPPPVWNCDGNATFKKNGILLNQICLGVESSSMSGLSKEFVKPSSIFIGNILTFCYKLTSGYINLRENYKLHDENDFTLIPKSTTTLSIDFKNISDCKLKTMNIKGKLDNFIFPRIPQCNVEVVDSLGYAIVIGGKELLINQLEVYYLTKP